MKNQTPLKLLLVALCCMISVTYAANCSSVINDYITYLTTSDPQGYTRQVTFEMSSMKAPAKWVGYSTGRITGQYAVKKVGQFYLLEAYLYAKDATTVFSDRTWCPQQPAGQFLCFGYQRFDYRKADKFQMSLYSNSTGKIVLTTWGNATSRFPLQCKNGFLYASFLDTSGNGFLTISLRKDRYSPIK